MTGLEHAGQMDTDE